ncbi:hypothetical protein GWD52_07115 [Enterobacteriaceae bacterium 4M9]|nr:hypothetical protein [Enterobacteriaceae bacterium 4M9]
MAVRYLFIAGALLCLAGCIQVYGPVKAGAQQSGTSTESGSSGDNAPVSTVINNRHPDELYDTTLRYFHEKGLLPLLEDRQTSVIATAGDNPELSSLYLDCSTLKQTQNIQEQYRIAALIWSAGEGTRISLLVSGIAGLTTADGNDKVKPIECRSTGGFEKDLMERLRK